MSLPWIFITFGVLLMVSDTLRARKRILDYCRSTGLGIRSLNLTFGYSGPFSPFRGKYIFRGVLKKNEGGAMFHAWFSSAGMFSVTADDPLEVKFSR